MTRKTERPGFIRHYSEIERPIGHDDLQCLGAPFGEALGLARIGIHHEVVPPGRRTSYPHAERDNEEFVFVIEGNPEVWVDGRLYPLGPGDGIAFPPGTGVAHTFLNNTDAPVRLLIIGERRPENRVAYPLNPELRDRPDYWHDAPQQPLGPHDGRPEPTAQ